MRRGIKGSLSPKPSVASSRSISSNAQESLPRPQTPSGESWAWARVDTRTPPSVTTPIWPRPFGVSMLVDTGAWCAITDSSDRHHKEASRYYTEHAGHIRFVTTDLIVAETWTLLHSHLGRPSALIFWETLRETSTPILT